MATTGGCSCGPCRSAQTRYVKQWRLARQRGHEFKVDAAPTHRKIRALNAIGVTNAAIASEAGYASGAAVSNILGEETILSRTEVRLEQAYRRLEMTIVPPSRNATRLRNQAKREGWPPPLAYDDIHNNVLADQRPAQLTAPRNRFDPLEVEYVLQYDDWEHARRRLSRPEKIEVVRLWVASGRPEAELCRLTGWREGRYRSTQPTQEAS